MCSLSLGGVSCTSQYPLPPYKGSVFRCCALVWKVQPPFPKLLDFCWTFGSDWLLLSSSGQWWVGCLNRHGGTFPDDIQSFAYSMLNGLEKHSWAACSHFKFTITILKRALHAPGLLTD